ncbi:hypothetical protein PC116_g31024 [Phytophthora cactorum]|nr:hypothetical protein PC116_g31024 [Phytophthora cactorum]
MISAAARFIKLSATAIRADAAGDIKARVGFSPMAIASPCLVFTPMLKDVAVTATSATGVCQGPTIWSRAVRPPTVRSPIVIRNDFDPTAGIQKTLCRAFLRSSALVDLAPNVALRLAIGSNFGSVGF